MATATGKAKDTKMAKTRTVLPPFLKKLRIITETCPPDIAGWSEDGLSYEVYNSRFEEVLSLHFKGTLSTFIRQLHFYGCNKKEKNGCEFVFVHKYLQRDHPELIERIKRKTRGDAVEGFASTEDVQKVGVTVNALEASIMDIRAKLIRASKKLGVDFVPKVTQLRPDSPPTENTNKNNKSNNNNNNKSNNNMSMKNYNNNISNYNNNSSNNNNNNNKTYSTNGSVQSRGYVTGVATNKPRSNSVGAAVANRNLQNSKVSSQMYGNTNYKNSNNNNNNNNRAIGTSPVVVGMHGGGTRRTTATPLPSRTLQPPPNRVISQTAVKQENVRASEAPLGMGKPTKSNPPQPPPLSQSLRIPATTVPISHKFQQKASTNTKMSSSSSTDGNSRINTQVNRSHAAPTTTATTNRKVDRLIAKPAMGVHNTANNCTTTSVGTNNDAKVKEQQFNNLGASALTAAATTTATRKAKGIIAKPTMKGPGTMKNYATASALAAAAVTGSHATTATGATDTASAGAATSNVATNNNNNNNSNNNNNNNNNNVLKVGKAATSTDGDGNRYIGDDLDLPSDKFAAAANDELFGSDDVPNNLELRRGVSDGSVAAAVRLGFGNDMDMDIDGDEAMMQFLDNEALDQDFDGLDLPIN